MNQYPVIPSGRRGAGVRDPVTGRTVPYSGFADNTYKDHVSRLEKSILEKLKWTDEKSYLADPLLHKTPCRVCNAHHFAANCPAVYALGDQAIKDWGAKRAQATYARFMHKDEMDQSSD